MSEWQPIETAPRDASILICGGTMDWDDSWGENIPFTGVTIAEYDNPYKDSPHPWRGGNTGGHDTYYRYNPTHWMPLPSPPTHTGETDDA
jgi:hypothetical protein